MDTPVKSIGPDWRIPDALWERIEPLLPKRKPRRKKHPGRKPLPWRQVLDGIFYVLRTGCQWKAAPREFGSGSSLHRYFQLLVKQGVFQKLWKRALEEYDDLKGIQWEWQSLDAAMTKAPLGGGKNREEPHGPSQVRHQAFHAHRRGGRALGGGRGRGERTRQALGETDAGKHRGRASPTDAAA